MPQHSPTDNDILTIFIGHRYYRTYRYYHPAVVPPLSTLPACEYTCMLLQLSLMELPYEGVTTFIAWQMML